MASPCNRYSAGKKKEEKEIKKSFMCSSSPGQMIDYWKRKAKLDKRHCLKRKCEESQISLSDKFIAIAYINPSHHFFFFYEQAYMV